MKRLFYIAAATMAVLSACTKESPLSEGNHTEPESTGRPVFKAAIERQATRTTIGEGNKVNWVEGDEVLMTFTNEELSAMALCIYEAVPDDDASTASSTLKTSEAEDPAADRLMHAIYPASMFSIDHLEFPAVQVYGACGEFVNAIKYDSDPSYYGWEECMIFDGYDN